jgi:nucleotide-binding universal stress UspA family protein
MNVHPTILCPLDFSEASRGALRYAAAIASQFGTRLLVMTVEDPLLTEALDLGSGVMWGPEDSRRELAEFASKTFDRDSPAGVTLEYEVAVGKPAVEILRVARERSCDLIVISTRGVTGMRKLFFGSTTERVLRDTTCPVLLTPHSDPGPIALADARATLHRILVPVDLSDASLHQVQVARGLSEALSVPLVVAHVVEPLRSRLAARLHLPGVEVERRAVAEDALNELVATLPRRGRPEGLLAWGDPAEEIAKIAQDRQAGLIVMGLHGSPLQGPRMGSVTYRVLCLVPTVVLAVPPAHASVPAAARIEQQGGDVSPRIPVHSPAPECPA